MSQSDAFVWIMCDACMTEEQASLPFVYGGLMHADGRYDHKKPRLPQGWVQAGDDKHFCEDCTHDGAEAQS